MALMATGWTHGYIKCSLLFRYNDRCLLHSLPFHVEHNSEKFIEKKQFATVLKRGAWGNGFSPAI